MISAIMPDPRYPISDPDVAISVQNLFKCYKLYNTPLDRMKESLHPFRRKYHNDFYALNDVSFEIERGETVGIIGKNGSGKSTLLKILTGVLTPTSGTVQVIGKVSALLELGAGFNPELSGVENVYFNGTLMGYTREEIDVRLDDILAFADIGDFVYQPVKMYSSGMFVRLAFAVAVSVEPEILIVDEALSVGDIFFQQKCYTEIRNKIDKGITCLFVSHDAAAISNICNRVILFDKGIIRFDGPSVDGVSKYLASIGERAVQTEATNVNIPIIDEYTHFSHEQLFANNILPNNAIRHGAGGAAIAAIRITDVAGNDRLSVDMLNSLLLSVLIMADRELIDPNVVLHIFDRLGNIVFATGTRNLGVVLPRPDECSSLLVCLRVTFNLQPGEYTFSIAIAEPSAQGPDIGFVLDRIDSLGPITVMRAADIQPFWGIAQIPVEVVTATID